MVSLTLVQTASVVGMKFRVRDEITLSVDIDPAVFVFAVETQTFSHYATPADMESYPNTLAQATTNGKDFYRGPILERDWDFITDANVQKTATKARLQLLVRNYEIFSAAFAGTTTTTIVS